MGKRKQLDFVELEKDLREKLAEDGKPAAPDKKFSKTDLWYWSTDRAAYDPKAVVGRKFSSCDEPRSAFYSIPPLENVPTANRVLVVSTKYEGQVLDRVLERVKSAPDSASALEQVRQELYTSGDGKRSLEKGLSVGDLWTEIAQENGEIVRCARMAAFWEKFFGAEKFMDELDKITVPKRMITTGLIRTYGYMGGCTDDVSGRLKEIAEHWKMPVNFITSCAP